MKKTPVIKFFATMLSIILVVQNGFMATLSASEPSFEELTSELDRKLRVSRNIEQATEAMGQYGLELFGLIYEDLDDKAKTKINEAKKQANRDLLKLQVQLNRATSDEEGRELMANYYDAMINQLKNDRISDYISEEVLLHLEDLKNTALEKGLLKDFQNDIAKTLESSVHAAFMGDPFILGAALVLMLGFVIWYYFIRDDSIEELSAEEQLKLYAEAKKRNAGKFRYEDKPATFPDLFK